LVFVAFFAIIRPFFIDFSILRSKFVYWPLVAGIWKLFSEIILSPSPFFKPHFFYPEPACTASGEPVEPNNVEVSKDYNLQFIPKGLTIKRWKFPPFRGIIPACVEMVPHAASAVR
jgi:hypothetical protein